MLFDSFFSPDETSQKSKVDRLESFHQGKYSLVTVVLLCGMVVFIVWANIFKLDQVSRATGEVIASSRVQIIQSVDGGVLSSLNVKEGDSVKAGQILAELDKTRIGAAVKEIDVRVSALQAKATRLKSEIIDSDQLVFSDDVLRFTELVTVERALFKQRRTGLKEELRTLEVAVALAKEETQLLQKLKSTGDVNRSEVIKKLSALNEAEAKLINRKNRYLEEASIELAKVEDAIAQNIQVLAQRKQQLQDSTFRALVPGIVKNVSVTTIGGVLRAGEELMQIIPIEDELIIEAKVTPSDIALVKTGLTANIKFDPFDYTIFGGVEGEVVYVSADTLKEESSRGVEVYYRVHILSKSNPVTTNTGKVLAILPGMTAQVDIKTGERTVMAYLLKPLRKTLNESFGER